jgi:trehalose 6-phosphate synthase/phosphatase
MYHERTDGSYIERKESSLAWIYREADPEFGLWQAEELIEHLQEALKGKPIYIASGGGYVEVKPQGINKVKKNSSII